MEGLQSILFFNPVMIIMNLREWEGGSEIYAGKISMEDQLFFRNFILA